MAKNTRRNRRANRRAERKSRRSERKSRRNSRRNRRAMYGGAPAPVNDNSMQGSEMQSLQQGNQFAAINKNFHGGAALVGGPYPNIVTDPTILPESLRASARVAPLDSAIAEVSGLKDPGTVSGGARRHRKANRKSRKNRKANRKSRKATRKSRKANRKSRKSRNYYGGAYSLDSAAPFGMTKSDMLLSPALEAKALQGMNSEWKLAENPAAFAPGYKQ